MSRSKWSTRRKSLAIGLAVVGVAGLSLASASQLTMNWGQQTFQAGNVTVKTDCQTTPITVTYDSPTFLGTQTNPWTIANVNFVGIDATCNQKTYEVAYKVGTGAWTQTTPTSGTVSATGTTNTITTALPAGVDPSTITAWALTIHS